MRKEILMTPEKIAKTYLEALERGDLPTILDLFAPEGMVHSPLYGAAKAYDFYPALLKDTERTKIDLKGIAEGKKVDGQPLVMLWFQLDWTLRSGKSAHFECADVIEINETNHITALRIIYDTATARPVYEKEHG
jgi:hypothetical protein